MADLPCKSLFSVSDVELRNKLTSNSLNNASYCIDDQAGPYLIALIITGGVGVYAMNKGSSSVQKLCHIKIGSGEIVKDLQWFPAVTHRGLMAILLNSSVQVWRVDSPSFTSARLVQSANLDSYESFIPKSIILHPCAVPTLFVVPMSSRTSILRVKLDGKAVVIVKLGQEVSGAVIGEVDRDNGCLYLFTEDGECRVVDAAASMEPTYKPSKTATKSINSTSSGSGSDSVRTVKSSASSSLFSSSSQRFHKEVPVSVLSTCDPSSTPPLLLACFAATTNTITTTPIAPIARISPTASDASASFRRASMPSPLSIEGYAGLDTGVGDKAVASSQTPGITVSASAPLSLSLSLSSPQSFLASHKGSSFSSATPGATGFKHALSGTSLQDVLSVPVPVPWPVSLPTGTGKDPLLTRSCLVQEVQADSRSITAAASLSSSSPLPSSSSSILNSLMDIHGKSEGEGGSGSRGMSNTSHTLRDNCVDRAHAVHSSAPCTLSHARIEVLVRDDTTEEADHRNSVDISTILGTSSSSISGDSYSIVPRLRSLCSVELPDFQLQCPDVLAHCLLPLPVTLPSSVDSMSSGMGGMDKDCVDMSSDTGMDLGAGMGMGAHAQMGGGLVAVGSSGSSTVALFHLPYMQMVNHDGINVGDGVRKRQCNEGVARRLGEVKLPHELLCRGLSFRLNQGEPDETGHFAHVISLLCVGVCKSLSTDKPLLSFQTHSSYDVHLLSFDLTAILKSSFRDRDRDGGGDSVVSTSAAAKTSTKHHPVAAVDSSGHAFCSVASAMDSPSNKSDSGSGVGTTNESNGGNGLKSLFNASTCAGTTFNANISTKTSTKTSTTTSADGATVTTTTTVTDGSGGDRVGETMLLLSHAVDRLRESMEMRMVRIEHTLSVQQQAITSLGRDLHQLKELHEKS